MTILFDEELHKYFYKEAPELKLTSVSKIIEMYHEEFDTEKVAEKTAAKRGVTKESLIEEWKKTNSDAIKRGHAYHFYKEQKYLKQGKINGLKVFAHETDQNLKKGFDITKLVPGIYPELIVDLPEFQVIGTADYIEIFEDGTFILEDHKTNGKLESEGFKVWDPVSKTKKSKMMYAPISHIHHCNLGHYSIQLSIYAFALEEAGFNLRPNGLTINHVLFDEDGTAVDTIPYKLNYLKKEVKNLLNHFKQNHLPKIQK